MVTSDSSHTQHRSTAACSTAALQTAHQVSWLFSLSDEGMSTGVLSCHMSIMALNVHNTLSISIWPSLLKTRWRDVASTPPGPHTPHHTLGKLVTKASWWQPSSSVSMYPCIPALQLCSVSMYPARLRVVWWSHHQPVLEVTEDPDTGYTRSWRPARDTSTASLDHSRPGMLGGIQTFGDASLRAGLQGEIVRFRNI